MTTSQHVIDAAMDIAKDVAEGRIAPTDLESAAVEQCRELFATVYGPADPLWSVHVDVARQVLAFGGLGADELAEWVAVQRTRAGLPVTEPERSWIERALADGADDEDDDWPAEPGDDVAASDAVREAMAAIERRLRGDDEEPDDV